ncbi:MAG: hypothetical protein MUC43_10495 [Pirellula sp.]|jgi:hypothetical protein|nr:hypothetical protein [Pirellula sp.]
MSTNRRRINKKAKHGGVALSIPPATSHVASANRYHAIDESLLRAEALLSASETIAIDPCDEATSDQNPSNLPPTRSVETASDSRFAEHDSAIHRSGDDNWERTGSHGSSTTSPATVDVLDLIQSKLCEIVDGSAKLERERLEIQELRSQLQHAIDSAELRMAQIDRSAVGGELSGDPGILGALRAENDRLTSLLKHTRDEYQTLLDFIENEDIKELTTSVRNEHLERECELNREIDRLKAKINLLQDDLGSSLGTGSEAELKKQLTSVKNELMDARHEVVDLRLQCNELASRLAKFQDPNAINHDSISWEDRKQALLHMLEQQDQEEFDSAEKILEMKQILEETSVQIQIREKEIADLRSLLEQQSIASNGLAVGAAAIANLVDADEIIAEERQRLKEMQLQWEQKQRQGEIEMSLERAKLARERLEIQDKMQQIEAEKDLLQRAAENSSQTAPAPHKGRWWARLGLRDD